MVLALDGSGYGLAFFGNSQAAVLTTTQSNDVIIVDIYTQGGPITSVTAPGLTFAQRASAYLSIVGLERWWAIAASPLSAVSITVNSTTNGNLVPVAYGISGANTSSPFQVASVTAENVSGGVDPLSITTTGAAMVIAAYETQLTPNITAGSGFTPIFDATTAAINTCIEYQIEASAGTVSPTLATGAGMAQAGIVDAIAPASAGGDTFANNGSLIFMRDKIGGLLKPVRKLFVPGFRPEPTFEF